MFCMIFERKYFPGYILLTYKIYLSAYFYFVWYWVVCLLTFTLCDIGQCVYCNCLLIKLCRHQPYLLNQPFFLLDLKLTILNILRTKRNFKMKQKAFFGIVKRLSLNQIKQIFLKGESLTLIILITIRKV